MQFLKAVVIVMGVLIVAGFVVVATTIYQRAGKLADSSSDAEGPPDRAAPSPFAARQIVIPSGSAVRQVTVAGERLVVWLSDFGGTQRIMVLDLGTGEELGTFEIKESP